MFKIGDRIVEVATGDEGTITAPFISDEGDNAHVNNHAWWVLWDNEEDEMFIGEQSIEHVI